MRNQRSTFIPLSTKSAKNIPKSTARKSSSCQTERVVLIKEENLSFHSRFGQNDGGMKRDYAKAVNYINSCHKFINTIIEKNHSDKTNMFLLPMVPNFGPIFPLLTGKKSITNKPKDKGVEETKKCSRKSEERKSKSNFGVKKASQEAPIDPAVGDCGSDSPQNDKYATQVADIIKTKIHHFLNNLQDDMSKAMKKQNEILPRQKCKNLDIVKQRLEELSKICSLQKNMESNPKIVHSAPLPRPPPFQDAAEECSVILSDFECEELRKSVKGESPPSFDHSIASLLSESSDIKSDSDLEIKF